MKNLALIIAGGVGARTHQDIPKQFINVHDIPVIVYTLEAFQNAWRGGMMFSGRTPNNLALQSWKM